MDPLILESLIHEYKLGVTKDRSIIYYQIDTKNRCRTGKIMKYDPITGHRIKDPDTPSKITWVHSILKSRGRFQKTGSSPNASSENNSFPNTLTKK